MTRSFASWRKSFIIYESPIHERRSVTSGPAPISIPTLNLDSLHRNGWGALIDFSLIEHRIGSHMRWHGGQHLLFAVNQIASVECREFESVTMGDRIRGTSFYAISTENAAVVINVVNLGVALRAADPIFGCVFSRKSGQRRGALRQGLQH